MRTALAFLMAAVIPVLGVTTFYLYGQFQIFEPDDPFIWVRTRGFATLAFVVALGFVILVGVPLYFLLRRFHGVTWWSTLLAGFAAAAIPVGVYTWPLRYSVTSASVNGTPTIVDGIPTIAGWLNYAEGVAYFGAWGFLGALAFWYVAPNKSRL